MKICPRCQKTYGDDNLNFCLDDGTTLVRATAADNSIPATVMMNQPRPTNQPAQFGNQGAAPPNWNAPPQFSTPPKKSKTWLWALGIVGGLMLICGGGFVGFLFWAASLNTGNSNRFVANTGNYNPNPVNKSKPINTSTDDPSLNASVQTIDLSRWVNDDIEKGATEFTDGELFMSSAKKNYYYVLAAPAPYRTENAATKLTVRNVNHEKTNLGFGLIINSNPVPLTQDYAFLIDSENKKYRIVRHKPGDEMVVVGWTRTALIKSGAEKNVLEVRDADKKMDFYINGEFIKSLSDTDGYSGGVTGIYASDAVQIAFSDLEISK